MIYLVHHAEAVGPDVDPQRPLSADGRAHAQRLAAAAAHRGVKPAAILHSGKLRSRQTAEAFWRACNPLAEFKAIRGLQPSDPPNWIVELLAGDDRDIMLVGHMPHLPRLLRVMVAGTEDAAMAFPEHGLLALEPVGDRWAERWRKE